MEKPITERHLDKIEEYIYKTLQRDEMDLVQLFERINTYANLETISDYDKRNNLSYNGVKNNRNIVTLFGVKFVYDD